MFIGSVTSVQKKEITPHHPKKKLISDIFQKWLSMQLRQSIPSIEEGKRMISKPMFWWKVTCLVGALQPQAWQDIARARE